MLKHLALERIVRKVAFLTVVFSVCIRGWAGQYLVSTTADAGAGSLRQAILDADADPGPNTIVFQLAGSPPFSIAPATALPSLGYPTLIDGTSQSGYSGTPLIELNGASAGSGAVGLQFLSGACGVRALTINRFNAQGVILSGSSNIVQRCYIGTDVTGKIAQGNGGFGIWVKSAGNLIGGTNAGDGNVICGNSSGVYITGSGPNMLWGNWVGVAVTGTNALGNLTNGIVADGSGGNQIGGPDPAMRNVVAGNAQSAVYLNGVNARTNYIQGNYLGLDITGSRALTNGGDGITVNGAFGNIIAANIISGNALAGVDIVSGAGSNVLWGNFIGTDAAGAKAIGNRNAGVVIFGASNNVVGGALAGLSNVISGNVQDGVFLTNASWNLVQGNAIGLSAAGTNAIANGFNGVTLSGAVSNTIGGTNIFARNVISGNGYNGVAVLQLSDRGNAVLGNYIGTDVSGQKAVSNALAGVRIQACSNLIGGVTVGSGNVISGNGQEGIWLIGTNGSVSGNVVQGNLIGLDQSGAIALGNGNAGVGITAAANNLVGGSSAGARNVVSANIANGIFILNAGATNNLIQGNYIGTDKTGTTALGNGSSAVPAILIQSAGGNTIGGNIPSCGNVVSGNYQRGLYLLGAWTNLIQGNFIGTKADGSSALGNQNHGIEVDTGSTNNVIGGAAAGLGNRIAFAQNSSSGAGIRVRAGAYNNLISGNMIFSNGALGIDLGNFGVNGNIHLQAGVSSTDANRLQNFPVLSNAVTGTATLIRGSFDSALNKSYALEFFASPSGDTSGNGEGQLFLGRTNLALGNVSPTNFAVVLPVTVPAGWVITATATDGTNNTSEFSNWIPTWLVPQVQVAGSGVPGNCVLSWTNSGGSYSLVQSTNLTSPQWVPTGVFSTTVGSFSVPVNATNPAVYFRLQAL